MKSNLKLASEAPPRTPERERLAEAIAAADEAKRAEAAARDAVERANRMCEQAAAKTELAIADTAKIKSEQASRMAEAATKGTPLTPDRAMRDARSREADAQDELDAARAALATVEEALADAEIVHRKAGERLNAAVDAVVAPGAMQLLAETELMQAELANKRLILQYLRRSNIGAAAVNDFLGRPFLLAELNQTLQPHPACDPWVAAREALRQNADAELPTG